MDGFLYGFLMGLAIIGILVAIALPIVLTVFSPWWLLLYIADIPIITGILGMLDW